MSEILIDMELIRLVGVMRMAAERLEGTPESHGNLLAAIDAVANHFDDSIPGFRGFIADTRRLAVHEGPDITSDSNAGCAIHAAVVASEECLIDPNAPGAADMLEQAHDTVAMLLPDDGSPAPSDVADQGGPAEVEEPSALDRLSVIASDLMLLEASDKEGISRLQSQASDLAEDPELEVYGAGLEIVVENLGKAARARRKDSKEKALAVASDMMTSVMDHATTDELVRAKPEPDAIVNNGTDGEVHLCLEDESDEYGEVDHVAEAPEVAAPIRAEAEEDVSPTGSDEPAADLASSGNDGPVTVTLPATADVDLIGDFVTEGLEYVEHAEAALLALESDPGDKEAVNDVFRAFHTIKGVSGFLELSWITHFAHYAENLLSQVRDGSVKFRGPCSELTLRATDVIKQLIEQVQAEDPGASWTLPAGYSPVLEVLSDDDLVGKLARGEHIDVPSAFETDDDDGGSAGSGGQGKARGDSAGSVRVKTQRLDRLVDLVGELVIAHSMLAAHPAVVADQGQLAKTVDHSSKIMRELQDLSTGMRMVPLKPAFRKVSRVVRDVSKKMDKDVVLVTEGDDTEIDRTMVDVIADPLVHMVRNSLDHGLESKADRLAAGKPGTGTINLRAFQAGGNVVVEISDDGRGLDKDKILAKAIDRGVIDSSRNPTDTEIFNLIFEPGFSTAEVVTDISGRGVGMDVVRRSVESLRGRITIESTLGKGSTFAIHLPLTLAITDGMLVAVGNEVFIIPTVKIQMSFRPRKEQISTLAGRGEMVSILDDLLPVVRLHRLYDVQGAAEELTEGLLLIIGEGTRRTALLVDELVNQQQFVVKALQGLGSETPGIAGAAILGDGDVGLIIDPEELIHMARGSRNHHSESVA